jgi:putative ATPase
MILWGPPGVGKTTLAYILSQNLEVPFYSLSAINTGVKTVREVIEKAKASVEKPYSFWMRFIGLVNLSKTVYWEL